MLSTGWLIWLVIMFFFLLTPVSYGWGYRGWGAPYPSYIQRRRHQAAQASGSPGTFDHRAWGYTGDFVWFMVIIGVVWALSFYWMRPQFWTHG